MSNKKTLNFNHRSVIKKILDNLAEAKRPLPSYLDLYNRILTIIYNADINVFGLSDEKMTLFAKRISNKQPALLFEDIEVDWNKLLLLMSDMISIVAKSKDNNQNEINSMKQIAASTETLIKYARSWYENSDLMQTFTGTAVSSIVHGTMYPVLASYSDQILNHMKQDIWYQRFCPVCGGIADFSFLDKEKGSRWLVCSRCDSQWIFYRLICPFCGNDNHHTLSYLADDTSLYRLYLCDNCKHYVKCIDLRKSDHEVLMPLERLLTLDLDRQAKDLNYIAP